MPYLIGGIAVLAGLLLAAKWYSTADIQAIRRAFKWVLGLLIVAVALYLVLSGRWLFALMSLPFLWPLLRASRSMTTAARNFSRMAEAGTAGGASGQTSDVETRFLRLKLDHDSGEISGDILDGAFAGRRIEDLEREDVIALFDQCTRDDPESAQILEAYLDRVHPDWREAAEHGAGHASGGHAGGQSGQSAGAMGRDEALAVLGLEEGATRSDIKAAYQRLISGLHPDKGGSDYLAAKLNEARAVLLGD